MKFKVYSKVGMIILVALLLIVPLGMITGVVYERTSYRDQVIRDIERTWTGTQRVAGPVLSIPYLVDEIESFINPKTGQEEIRTRRIQHHVYWVPAKLKIKSRAETESLTRAIYEVPVFSSEHRLTGEFTIEQSRKAVESIEGFIEWGQPELSLIVSDIRGIGSNPSLNWNGVEHVFDAGSSIPHLNAGVHAEVELPQGTSRFPVEITLNLRGSQELSFTPLSGDLSAELTSNWPHPSFDGQFLPSKRDINEDGFSASWGMSALATDSQGALNDCATRGNCYPLNKLAFGVKFFEPVDIYVKVTRAIKYGALFIVLTFVAFFLTEILTKSRLHAMQYLLVGLALALFYLLLVSLSEHISFARAYVIATLACAGLVGVYLRGALGHKKLATVFSLGLLLLYAMLYAILRSEDFALLMGSLLLFAMLATVMMLTRRLDWYNMGDQNPQP